MFEYLFEKQGSLGSNIGVGANVVDDTEDITIPPSVEPKCEDYYTEAECLDHDCYWWGDPPSCHSESEVPPEEEFPWLIIAIVAGVAIVGAVVFAMFRK